MLTRLVIGFIGLVPALTVAADSPTGPDVQPWTQARAAAWYQKTGVLKGCNYLPRSAVNSTEMWQQETFDPKTIDEELAWAGNAGYNSARVFIQYLVWKHDPAGLKQRFERFLTIASKRGISVMPVPDGPSQVSGDEPLPE